MQKTDWKQLSERYPRHTLVRDPAVYADVFAAIDDAVVRAAAVEPSPDECEVIGHLPPEQIDEDDESGGAMLLWNVPVVPVRVPSTVRLCIGLLQYYHWPVQRSADGACLPHVDTLLKRKLRPTLDEAVDLAAFMTTRTGREDREDYSYPSTTILKLIERNFEPPVPEPLATVLLEVRRRVDILQTHYVADLRKWRGRPQTKRFDQWTERLNNLLGSR